MKLLIILLLSLVSASLSAPHRRAPLLAADSPVAVEGEYIVVFRDEVTVDQAEQHRAKVQSILNGTQSKIEYVYHIGKEFMGYAAMLSAQELEMVLSMADVAYVQRSQAVQLDEECTSQPDAEWGLVRTTTRERPTITDYVYDLGGSGEGVDAYIIDTGIYIEHNDFSGRAKYGYDVFNPENPQTDGHGHGTHVAGTILGDQYGLAKKATAIAVKALTDFGSGTSAGIIAGIDWVANQHTPGKKSVANMSLGTSVDEAINNAVNAAIDKGVNFGVSAGNDYGSACNKSPASALHCVTVGATDMNDKTAPFSNQGKCVDIFAPGVNVKAPWKGSPDATNTISGTSMAAPHVVGVMAKLLSAKDYTPTELKQEIIDTATPDKVEGITDPDTPNLLIFKDCTA